MQLQNLTSTELLWTAKQTARALGISERKLHDIDEIPRVRIGRSVRFDPKDIEAFIASRKAAPNA